MIAWVIENDCTWGKNSNWFPGIHSKSLLVFVRFRNTFGQRLWTEFFSLLVRCLILKVCSGYFQQNLSDQNSSELEKFSAPYRHPLSPSIPASTSDHTATHCAKTNFDGARDQARIDLIGLNQKEDFYCRECSPSVDQSQISCSSTFHRKTQLSE